MSTPPKIGSTNFNDALSRINTANAITHHCLKQLVEDPGPETRRILVTKMSLALIDNQRAADELTEIGRQAKTTQPLSKGQTHEQEI